MSDRHFHFVVDFITFWPHLRPQNDLRARYCSVIREQIDNFLIMPPSLPSLLSPHNNLILENQLCRVNPVNSIRGREMRSGIWTLCMGNTFTPIKLGAGGVCVHAMRDKKRGDDMEIRGVTGVLNKCFICFNLLISWKSINYLFLVKKNVEK